MEEHIINEIRSSFDMPPYFDTSSFMTMEENIRQTLHSSIVGISWILRIDEYVFNTMNKCIREAIHLSFANKSPSLDPSFLASMEEGIIEATDSSFRVHVLGSIRNSFLAIMVERIIGTLHSSLVRMPVCVNEKFHDIMILRIREAMYSVNVSMPPSLTPYFLETVEERIRNRTHTIPIKTSDLVPPFLTTMEEYILEAIHSNFVTLPPSLISSVLATMKESYKKEIHTVLVSKKFRLDPTFLATMAERISEAIHSSFVSMSPSLDPSLLPTMEEGIKEIIHSSFVIQPPSLAPSFLAKMEERIKKAINSRDVKMPDIMDLPLFATTKAQMVDEIKSRLKLWYREVYPTPRVQSESKKPEEHQQNEKQMESDFSWMDPIEAMLGSLNHEEVQACSISSVPDKLREANEDAYKPEHISIGPLHRGTRHLQLMEETKWHYMHKFLNRPGTEREQNRSLEVRLRACGFDIRKLDIVICASYGGSNDNIIKEIESHEIAKIMIVDGCFLLELLMTLVDYMENPSKTFPITNDSIFSADKKVLSVLNDLAMLENQIPFIVLKKLYRKVFPDFSQVEEDHRVAGIVRRAFGYPLSSGSGGAHILHLMHLSTVDQNQPHEGKGKKAELDLLCCATKLRASGVTIEAKSNQDQHKWVDMFDFGISFSDSGVLEIPQLHIKETTEVKWRNLIAWEQNKIWIRCQYTSYALFFKGLICCAHDIELLLKKEVIVNDLNKSNEDLLKLFRTISRGVERMDSSYSQICERLNEYDNKGMKVIKVLQKLPIRTWHQCRCIFEIIVFYGRNWYNILIRDHIPTVWKFIGIMAAAMLLVLTIMQTYYSSRSG